SSAEARMSGGKIWTELRGFLACGHRRFEPLIVVRDLEFSPIGVAESCGCGGVIRIFFQRPAKERDGIVDLLGHNVVLKIATSLRIKIKRRGFCSSMGSERLFFLRREL